MAPRVIVAQLSIYGQQVPPGTGGRRAAAGRQAAGASAAVQFVQPRPRKGHRGHSESAKHGLAQPANTAAVHANLQCTRFRNRSMTFLLGQGLALLFIGSSTVLRTKRRASRASPGLADLPTGAYRLARCLPVPSASADWQASQAA